MNKMNTQDTHGDAGVDAAALAGHGATASLFGANNGRTYIRLDAMPSVRIGAVVVAELSDDYSGKTYGKEIVSRWNEVNDLRARLAACEASRAELGWALEVANDSLERISAAGPQIEEWHLAALAGKWNMAALASHTIHSDTHRKAISIARSGGLEGVRRAMSSCPQ